MSNILKGLFESSDNTNKISIAKRLAEKYPLDELESKINELEADYTKRFGSAGDHEFINGPSFSDGKELHEKIRKFKQILNIIKDANIDSIDEANEQLVPNSTEPSAYLRVKGMVDKLNKKELTRIAAGLRKNLGITQLDEVDPHNFDSDVDYYDAVRNQGKQQFSGDWDVWDEIASLENQARHAGSSALAHILFKQIDQLKRDNDIEDEEDEYEKEYDADIRARKGVAEAKASTSSFRRGNDKRAELNSMTDDERKAYDKEQQEKQRKRDDARLERERQKNAAKKGVTEGYSDMMAKERRKRLADAEKKKQERLATEKAKKDKKPQGVAEGLEHSKRQQLIRFLAKKLGWEHSYLELASDANLISWYKKVQAGKDPMRENKSEEADYGDDYQAIVQRVGQKAKEQEKKKPVDIQALARRLNQPEKKSNILKGIEENLGTPYPSTYEEENKPFQKKGAYRITAMTSESKK